MNTWDYENIHILVTEFNNFDLKNSVFILQNHKMQ